MITLFTTAEPITPSLMSLCELTLFQTSIPRWVGGATYSNDYLIYYGRAHNTVPHESL